MDVYLVPAGPSRHVLYCEPAGDAAGPPFRGTHAVWRRLHEAFRRVLAAVEREHERAHSMPSPPAGLLPRLRARGLRWVSERVAEQRVLWHLQGQHRVRAFHPAALDDAGALSAIHESLRADSDRHGRWLVLDAVFLLVSLVLTPLPGPNVPGYYFTFRVVGHFLSVRGARHGLRQVAWDLQPSEPLDELVGLERLPSAQRGALVHAIAEKLGLPRLARFVERTVGETA